MTQDSGMPQNPGDPENTDPEATSADRAEAAAEKAEEAQAANDAQADASEEAKLDPTLDADLEDALADVNADEVEAEAEGDEPTSTGAATNDVEAQLAERTEDLQRLNAEYTNYRRRTERDRQSVIETAKAKVISDLLPVLDDLDLAKQHGDLEGPLKAVADKLRKGLEQHSLTAFGEEGEPFDPEMHEAVQDLSSGDEQVLGTVLRQGYRVGERLVRNALVIIADPGEDSGSSEGTEQAD